ncbi:GGDEF domain-containing protein [Pseudomonas sp. BN414]|uniref:GGDEF domain-containing protein n=1 Tax=Pseudomonas sp. BN414 TaxID=2567888 RepID=UPI0024586FAE|nr:GGDEF domain-containing protein [Pseudomonas sp. BN414]MDH4569220.1 GGDEF domain-containing protein [Pseudomonas sp. BN414]
MQLNVPTLVLVDIYVLALVGLLMLHAWRRGRREPTLGYLAAMLLLGALGTVLGSLRGIGTDFVPLVLGNVVLHFCAAMNWTAMRVFAGRQPHVPGICAGALVWVLLCLNPAFYESLTVRIAVSSLITVCYCGLSAHELWRSRQSLEVAYMPALLLTVFHMVFYSVRIVIDRGMPFDAALASSGQGTNFFSLLVFETLLYAIGIAFVTLSMVKERAELKFRAAAYCDPLTGVGNRRAFMTTGEYLLESCEHRREPVALLLCDLDHFKRLNDSYGHATGDEALVAFTRIAVGSMRKQDVFGRIGGEEFACLLADADDEAGAQVAERIRREFAEVPFQEPGELSVSIGIVSSRDAGYDLFRLLSLADDALYAAKDKGRNRIQRYPAD